MNRYLAGKSYMKVATRTATPGQLVLMLYDGAIRFLEAALRGFAIDDPAEFNETINNNIQKAQAILDELNAALNVADGGELAANLRNIYGYLDRRLFEANMRKDSAGVEEAVKRLVTIRDAWREMLGLSGAADPNAAPQTLTAVG